MQGWISADPDLRQLIMLTLIISKICEKQNLIKIKLVRSDGKLVQDRISNNGNEIERSTIFSF